MTYLLALAVTIKSGLVVPTDKIESSLPISALPPFITSCIHYNTAVALIYPDTSCFWWIHQQHIRFFSFKAEAALKLVPVMKQTPQIQHYFRNYSMIRRWLCNNFYLRSVHLQIHEFDVFTAPWSLILEKNYTPRPQALMLLGPQHIHTKIEWQLFH